MVNETEEDEDDEEEACMEAASLYPSERESLTEQTPSHSSVPRLYEEQIQKLEKDIRLHIACENQMRIHIENLTGKVEEQEADLASLRDTASEEKASMKREKRRLDDLLTIREGEIDRLESMLREIND